MRCLRLPRLVEDLARAEGQRKKSALFRQLAKVQLLMLDDFGLTPLTNNQQRDLLELLDDRYDKASTDDGHAVQSLTGMCWNKRLA